MINAIIEFSAKNKIVVFILIAAAVMVGLGSMRTVPLDALPDMSDTQAIVYSRWDRSPDVMEDEVTYPLVTAMLGAPKVKGFQTLGTRMCTSFSTKERTLIGPACSPQKVHPNRTRNPVTFCNVSS